MATQQFDSGSGNFTVPAGVTTVQIELWGGGGTGGAGGSLTGGTGGGGGGYCKVNALSVTPGDLIAYVVGGSGTTTTVEGGTYTAGGGVGGGFGGAGGAAGTGGDVGTAGSAGAANSGAVGGDGGDSPNGGTGGTGGLDGQAGTAGNAPGGGGGGGGAEVNGSAGASGRVLFTYTSGPSTYDETASGGAVIAGDVELSGIEEEIGSGGILGDGSSDLQVFYTIDGSGGVSDGGDGGVGGVNNFDETGLGGGDVGGVATFGYDETGLGGVLGAGDSPVAASFYAQGGVLAAGDSPVAASFYAQGGAVLNGLMNINWNIHLDGSGGARLAGIANVSLGKLVSYVNNDPTKTRVVVGGNAVTKLDLSYNADHSDGDVQIGGNAEVNFEWSADLILLWRLNALIVSDMEFLWNTGELQLFWYRVIGNQEDRCSLQPCCMKVIHNVFARTPAELCEKLSERKFQFKIDSVQRFTRPAENANVSATDDCNQLEPVEICQVPACADFCVDFTPKVYIGFETRVQVDSFFYYEGTGIVYTGGSSGVNLHRELIDLVYSGSGSLTIAGESDNISSGYAPVPEGGITMSGSAGIKSSAWSYVGGIWPLTTGDKNAVESESLEDVITDVAWGAIDRVLVDDALPTQIELSYGKTSEFLIVRNFDIHIPDDAEILGVVVRVNRSSSNIGVRDSDVYLLVGDEIISDNLANTDFDLPLIQTEWWYGIRGLEGDIGTPWVADDSDISPLQASDLNDPTFGFAYRITSTTVLPAIFAFVTYIDMEIFYQDAGDVQILRVGGNANVVSSSYSYEGSGGISIGDTAGLRIGINYISTGVSQTLTAAFSTGGSYGLNFYYDPDSEEIQPITLGGLSVCRPSWQLIEATGGASLGGDVKVTPYFEDGTGGISAEGEANTNNFYSYAYEASGGIDISGIGSPLGEEVYGASGGVSMSGEASYKSSAYHFTSDGNAIFVLGGADVEGSDLGTQFYNVGADFKIIELNFYFADSTTDAIDVPASTVNRCDCFDMPLITQISHNLAHDNRLSQFLARNNFTISRVLDLKYNVPNDSWQTNLHYRGVSSKSNNLEDWDILFELRCTSNSGGIEIGNNIWQFSVQVSIEDSVTGEDFDTRILVGIIPDLLCSGGQLVFNIDYDADLDFVSVDPSGIIYNNILYDNIGLFKNRIWMRNPILSFQISQIGLNALTPRYDASGFGNNKPMKPV